MVDIHIPACITPEQIRQTFQRMYRLMNGDLNGINAANVTYNNVTYPNVDAALDELLDPYYTPIVSLSGGSTNEVGSTVANVNLTWTVDSRDDITTQTLTDVGSIGAAVRAYDFTGVNLNTDKTYTVQSGDGTSTGSDSVTVAFRYKKYWGALNDTVIDDAEILALSNSELTTSIAESFTISPSGGYIWFCYPAAWGTATFTISGFTTIFDLTVQNHTNASGATASYNCYRSPNQYSGTNIEVTVS